LLVFELLIAPVSTLAAVVVTFVGSCALQARQQKHEARTRYHNARYEAYKQYVRLTNRALYSEAPPTEDQVEEAYAEITLVGTSNMGTAALNVYMNMILFLRQRRAGEGNAHTRQSVKRWLDQFAEVAREELEIPDD